MIFRLCLTHVFIIATNYPSINEQPDYKGLYPFMQMYHTRELK